MKLKIIIGSILWVLLITAAHVHMNVTWSRLGTELKVMFGGDRDELVVGFLPVT